MTTPTTTADELDAILADHAPDRPDWLSTLVAEADLNGLDDDDLIDLASERDERGPSATINGLFEALRVRHADDRVTLAMLAALQLQHLPDLRDLLRGL